VCVCVCACVCARVCERERTIERGELLHAEGINADLNRTRFSILGGYVRIPSAHGHENYFFSNTNRRAIFRTRLLSRTATTAYTAASRKERDRANQQENTELGEGKVGSAFMGRKGETGLVLLLTLAFCIRSDCWSALYGMSKGGLFPICSLEFLLLLSSNHNQGKPCCSPRSLHVLLLLLVREGWRKKYKEEEHAHTHTHTQNLSGQEKSKCSSFFACKGVLFRVGMLCCFWCLCSRKRRERV